MEDRSSLISEALNAFASDINYAISMVESVIQPESPSFQSEFVPGVQPGFIPGPPPVDRWAGRARPEEQRDRQRERVHPARPAPRYSFPVTTRWITPDPTKVVPPRSSAAEFDGSVAERGPGRPRSQRTPEEVAAIQEHKRERARERARQKYWRDRGYAEPPPIQEKFSVRKDDVDRPKRKLTDEEAKQRNVDNQRRRYWEAKGYAEPPPRKTSPALTWEERRVRDRERSRARRVRLREEQAAAQREMLQRAQQRRSQ